MCACHACGGVSEAPGSTAFVRQGRRRALHGPGAVSGRPSRAAGHRRCRDAHFERCFPGLCTAAGTAWATLHLLFAWQGCAAACIALLNRCLAPAYPHRAAWQLHASARLPQREAAQGSTQPSGLTLAIYGSHAYCILLDNWLYLSAYCNTYDFFLHGVMHDPALATRRHSCSCRSHRSCCITCPCTSHTRCQYEGVWSHTVA